MLDSHFSQQRDRPIFMGMVEMEAAEKTALQIQENTYLQYFCGYSGYDSKKLPFDPSLMVYSRKRLTLEVLGKINEMLP